MGIEQSAQSRTGGVMSRLRAVERVITRVVEMVGVILVALMVIDVAIGVFTRYVLADPVPWSEEASRFMLVWTAFMGAALAVRRGSHFGILMILHQFPPSVRRVIVVLIAIGMAGFMFLMVRIGWNLTVLADAQISPALGVRLSWVYISIPISGTLMLFYLLLDVVDFVTTGRSILGADPIPHAE